MTRNISRRDLLTKVVPASAALAIAPTTLLASTKAAFYHGIASGDPTQTEVIIWTRVTTSKRSIDVVWEIAHDESFSDLVAQGELQTSQDNDYTVKIDVTSLQPATVYYYRFAALDIQSEVGRTQTLPAGEVDSFRMGVCSCANYPGGYFNAYAAMANDHDLNVVVHLGDYIYEYDALGYASAGAEALGRVSEPLNEVTRLADFRRRHGQYKSDKQLQTLHARVPFILSWDDHETANDTWKDGAENHNEGEGDWAERKAAGLQAYYEWMPIREPKDRDRAEQWRSFEIGNLATLVMLETRLTARDEQVELARDMLYVKVKFDISDPDNPQLVANNINGEHIEVLNQPFDVSLAEPKQITDYQQIKEFATADKLPDGITYYPDIPAFTTKVLDHPDRQILGKKQRQFVSSALQRSTQSNKPWQLIGNQTLIGKIDTPNLAEGLTQAEQDKLPEWLRPLLFWSRFGVPFGTDSWNGYGAEREWLLAEAEKQKANMIVLTGDTHAAWGIDLVPQSGGDWHGLELGATSITSPGLPEALGVEGPRLSELLMQANDNVHYSETAHRGFLVLDITAESINADFHRVSTVADKSFADAGKDRLRITHRNAGNGVKLNKA